MSIDVFNDKYTIEDYMNLKDDRRYELVEGELVLVPRPTLKHQKVANRFFSIIESYVVKKDLGEVNGDVDVHLGEEVVAPDVLFVSKDRLHIVGELYIQGAPDLVIEVLSPTTVRYDKKVKGRLYFTHGVKEYWLVDPNEKIVEVLMAGEKDWRWAGVYDQEDVLMSPLLPGLQINLGEVFNF